MIVFTASSHGGMSLSTVSVVSVREHDEGVKYHSVRGALLKYMLLTNVFQERVCERGDVCECGDVCVCVFPGCAHLVKYLQRNPDDIPLIFTPRQLSTGEPLVEVNRWWR